MANEDAWDEFRAPKLKAKLEKYSEDDQSGIVVCG
jgi:hypothetical protein